MLLSNIAPITATISGLTATASLIYARDPDPAERAPHPRYDPPGTAARTTNVLLRMMDLGSLSRRGSRATAARRRRELIRRRQYHHHRGAAMVAMEDYFSQHEEGLLGDEQFARGSATFRQSLKEPGLRAYWLRYREETMIRRLPSA